MGLMDATGRIVVAPRYLAVTDTVKRYASFQSSLGKWGVLDACGNIVVPAISDIPLVFRSGLAVASIEMGNTVGFLKPNGEWVAKGKFSMVDQFSCGLAPVRSRISTKWGFCDCVGEVVVPTEYEEVGPFSEGFAAVKKLRDREMRWGFIDKNGRILVDPRFEAVGIFREGLANVYFGVDQVEITDGVASSGIGWGYIDPKGKSISPARYADAKPFSESLAAVGVYAGAQVEWGIIDRSGRVICTPRFGGVTVTGQFREGVIAVRKLGGKDGWCYVGRDGKEAVPGRFDSASEFCGGVASVVSNGVSLYIDKAGNEVKPGTGNAGGVLDQRPLSRGR
jgi:hypothetical protein